MISTTKLDLSRWLARLRDMARIYGYYEWDDIGQRPGKSKDGGLHQNLYKDGNLTGHARFMPTDESQPTEFNVTENVFIHSENRRDDDEFAEIIVQLLAVTALKLGEMAAPHVKNWWMGTAWPYIADKNSRIKSKLRARKREHAKEISREPSTVGDLKSDSEIAVPISKMSAAEAKARVLAATAARAFSEEQLRMVHESEIVGAKGIEEVHEQLASIPREELIRVIEHLVRNPAELEEGNLANLARSLGQRHKELEVYITPED